MLEADYLRDMKLAGARAGISANGLMALSLAVALGFCVICSAILWQARRGVGDHAGQTASNLAAAINSDIARNIDQYDLSLQGVIEGLRLPEISQVSRQARQAILFDHSATAMYMGSIRVIDDKGNIVLDSRTLNPLPEDFSGREYFQIHKNNPDLGLRISGPFTARNGEYVLALSRRLSLPDDSFSGVVVGTLRLAYFHELFRKVSPSPRSALTLFTTGGTVIMRLPLKAEDIGRRLATAQAVTMFPNIRAGQYETVALLDGINRLYAFSQVDDFPLLMVVGLPIDEVYAGWWQEALVIGLLMLALCAATITSAVLLRGELRRRIAAEQKLAVLATTDSLTGLSNRRHFDEVMGREWQRAIREQTSIAVLMIDADGFKNYNDTHGHQRGDECLQAIGGCIADKTRRSTDLAARYGGEEFAVLLPGTESRGALEIAERIRINVTDLRLQHSSGPSGAPTVSIGVACAVPQPGSNHRDLTNAADKALYEAKGNGRNRTALAVEILKASPGLQPADAKQRLVA
jgi:diguanylate cyclase (GGDEF)-like protein